MTLYQGDALTVLRTLPDASVHCCVTSPPYWGLRDYGVPGQLGLEPTPELYVEHLVAVFREVRRVLRDDGTLWLNLGDSYAGSWGNYGAREGNQRSRIAERWHRPGYEDPRQGFDGLPPTAIVPGLKPKDLVGIPWRVAFALQADGWWLRQDIIWAKPNPMPESVRDRCTKAHEYVFLLSKSARYYYDQEAVKEPAIGEPSGNTERKQRPGADVLKRGAQAGSIPWDGKTSRKIRKPAGWDTGEGAHGTIHRDGRAQAVEYTETTASTRNRRSVWTVATQPYSGAHFATFPPKLIEPMVLAGCPAGGVVLDPFAGSGTTGAVAREWGREFIGIELNAAYIALAEERIGAVQPRLVLP